MQFPCRVEHQPDGTWRVRYQGTDVGPFAVTAADRRQALEKMRRELRYRLEYCPCTGELYDDVAIELVEQP